ncbi:MAG TPA: hypothetical protein VIK11_08025 [Tepidiformaceae bacterium]
MSGWRGLRLLFAGMALALGLLAVEAGREIAPRALAAPAVIYAAPSGTGPVGDGSLAHPYRILWMAGTQAGPGTTVYVRGGVYLAANEFISVTTGTAAAPVTFSPAPGEHGIVVSGQQLVVENNQGWNLSLRNTGNSNPSAGGWASAMNSNPRGDGTPSNESPFATTWCTTHGAKASASTRRTVRRYTATPSTIASGSTST